MTQQETLRKLTEDTATKLFLVRAAFWAKEGYKSNSSVKVCTPSPEELNVLYEELKKLTCITEVSLAK